MGTDGSETKIAISDWTDDKSLTYPSGADSLDIESQTGKKAVGLPHIITNADRGILVSWAVDNPAYCASDEVLDPYHEVITGCVSELKEYRLTTTNGNDANPSVTISIPDQLGIYLGASAPVGPALQYEDGTFVGTTQTTDSYTLLVRFDITGNVIWSEKKDVNQLLYALADGSTVYEHISYDHYPDITEEKVTVDSNGNETARVTDDGTRSSWKGNYRLGSTEAISGQVPCLASSFWATLGGMLAGGNTAMKEHCFALFWCGNDFGEQGRVNSTPSPCAQGGTDDVRWSYYPELTPTCPAPSCGFGAIAYFNDHPDWIGAIHREAFNSFKAAFATVPIIVILADGGEEPDYTVYVVGDYPFPGAGQKWNEKFSLEYYFANMEGAQEAFGGPQIIDGTISSGWVNYSPGYPPSDAAKFARMLEAMGKAIGNGAAHEIGHHLEDLKNISSNNLEGFPYMDCGLGEGHKSSNRLQPIQCENNDNFVYGFWNAAGEPQEPGDPESSGAMFFYGLPGGTGGIPSQEPIHWSPANLCWLSNYTKPGSCDYTKYK